MQNWIFGFRNYKIVWKNINSRVGDRLTKAAHIVKMEDEETEGIISETVVEEKVIEEKEEVSQNEPSEPLENLREKKEEENPWKEMDQQRFPADTVIIYESSNLENTIVRVIKIIAFCGILCGIMVSVITLAMGM